MAHNCHCSSSKNSQIVNIDYTWCGGSGCDSTYQVSSDNPPCTGTACPACAPADCKSSSLTGYGRYASEEDLRAGAIAGAYSYFEIDNPLDTVFVKGECINKPGGCNGNGNDDEGTNWGVIIALAIAAGAAYLLMKGKGG